MNELELLDQLKTIKEKMDKGEKLTDYEMKLFVTYLWWVGFRIFKYTVDWLLKSGILKGGDNHE